MKTNYTTQPEKAYEKPGEWGTVLYTSISYEMPALNATEPKTLKYKWVELNGIKWATKNIGAKDEYDPGLYFAWGETQGYAAEEVGVKKNFIENDYKFIDDGVLIKYNLLDGKLMLDPEDDAATVLIGPDWRMPTRTEAAILLISAQNYTDFYDGDNKISIPYGGYGEVDQIVGEDSSYYLWLKDQFAPMDGAYIHCNESAPSIGDDAPIFGSNIRAVYDPVITGAVFDTEVIDDKTVLTLTIDEKKYYIQGESEDTIVVVPTRFEPINSGSITITDYGELYNSNLDLFDTLKLFLHHSFYQIIGELEINKSTSLKTIDITVGIPFKYNLSGTYSVYHIYANGKRIVGWYVIIGDDGYNMIVTESELNRFILDSELLWYDITEKL